MIKKFVSNVMEVVMEFVTTLFDIHLLPFTIPVIMYVVGVSYLVYYSYSSEQEFSEKEARLTKEYNVTQFAGDCGNITFVFHTNACKPVGGSIKFVDEEKKETLVNVNFKVCPTK